MLPSEKEKLIKEAEKQGKKIKVLEKEQAGGKIIKVSDKNVKA
jgi:hypothetical protein